MLALLPLARSSGGERGPSPIVDPVTREAVGPGGDRIDLSPQQFDLLYALACLPWRGVLLWPDVVAAVYGEAARADYDRYIPGLNSMTRRLNRQKLAMVGWGRASVRTVRGHGLRLWVQKEYLLSHANDAQATVDVI